MAGATTQGTRMADGEVRRSDWPAGGYGRVKMDGEWVWCCRTPNGNGGMLTQHEIAEHEDGTVTVSPSILAYGYAHAEEWHGYLERGVWRSV